MVLPIEPSALATMAKGASTKQRSGSRSRSTAERSLQPAMVMENLTMPKRDSRPIVVCEDESRMR